MHLPFLWLLTNYEALKLLEADNSQPGGLLTLLKQLGALEYCHEMYMFHQNFVKNILVP